jgi:hypothetical protein
MSDPVTDCKNDGRAFAFTDEDFARRYSAERPSRPVAPAGPAPMPTPTRTMPLHGGGNSFMRAKRRRLAASPSSALGFIRNRVG